MDANISCDPSKPKFTQLIAYPIVDVPSQVISSDPPDGVVNVSNNKVITLTSTNPFYRVLNILISNLLDYVMVKCILLPRLNP